MNLYSFDDHYRSRGCQVVAGVDEAGRGPWAGPVVASAVILPKHPEIEGLNDSKKLTSSQREKIFNIINNVALSVSVEVVSHEVIDSINVLEATYKAMRSAVKKTTCKFDIVLVDGWPVPDVTWPQDAIISGDAKSAAIAAASVVAKVTRDRIMAELSLKYPQYNFVKHKGYGTKEHHEMLKKYGPCPIHRKSFRPIREILFQ